MTAKPKKELMKRLRRRRKAAGLIEFRAWVTESQLEWITEFLNESDAKQNMRQNGETEK